MIRQIVLKEIHDHLLSMRFQAGFLLSLVLVSCSAIVLAMNYRYEVDEQYWRARQENEFLSKYAHPNRIGVLRYERPPSPVLLVRGLPNDAGVETLDGSPMRELFSAADFTSIVAVVFSLFAIVLGFDGVNSERERGTLRLMLTNRLRRFEVLVAKWTAGMLVLTVAVLAALLAGAAIAFAIAGVRWGPDEWGAFAALFLAAILHTGAFFSLALALSAVAPRSSVSVLASVFTWVLLVLVVPNLSPYIAAQIVHIPSRAALERDYGYITSEERDDLGRKLQAKAQAKYAGSFSFGDIASEVEKQRLAADPALRRAYEQMRDDVEAAWTEANRIQGAKAQRLVEAYNAVARRQFDLSGHISYASPMPPLVYATTELAATGFSARRAFAEQSTTFKRGPMSEYIQRRYKEEQQKNPAYGWNDFMDMSSRPRFVYHAPPLADRLEAARWQFGLLAGWNVALFAAALLAFLRFDVR